MYTDPARIQQELQERRDKRSGLMQAVLEYLGGSLPLGWPLKSPIAVLARYIASARIEDMAFGRAATSIGLRPFWPTYHAEKYITGNGEKVSCLRPRIQRGGLSLTSQWLVANSSQHIGQPLGGIVVNGATLPQVHREVRRAVLPAEWANNVFDLSDWHHMQARRFGAPEGSSRLAPYYYMADIALYVCFGVLFEDFEDGPNGGPGLRRFVAEVLQPAIARVKSEFGYGPLIVRLPYAPGYVDYPPEAGEVFDRHRLAAVV